MGIMDAVKTIKDEQGEQIFKNTANEKLCHHNDPVKVKGMSLYVNNAKFDFIKEQFEKMNCEDYWKNAMAEVEAGVQHFLRGTKEYKHLSKIVIAEFEKKEKTFYAYRATIEDPLNMEQELKKLKSEINKLDSKIKELQAEQQSIFDDKGGA